MACAGPSLRGAFAILGSAGQDELLRLKHKLTTLRPACRGADLLHAMVLLQLGQDTEARIALEALRADPVARLAARQWAGVDSADPPEEPCQVSWAVARLYHLLAEEKLCPASMRDVAYQEALRALGSRDKHQLEELQLEARDCCGRDVLGGAGDFQPLHSELGCLPPSSALPSATRSLPRPIDNPSGWSRGCSLRSTGSLASAASNLEISQSPTIPFLSQPRSPGQPRRACHERPASPAPLPVPRGSREPEEMSWPPSVEPPSPPEPLDSPEPQVSGVARDPATASLPASSVTPETSTHYSVECTEVPRSLPSSPKSLPSPNVESPQNPCLVQDQTPLELSVDETTSQNTQPQPPASGSSSGPGSSASATEPSRASSTKSSACPAPSAPHPTSPAAPESSEPKFYSFVVLHARADEHIALRVRERLEELGVPHGATFCEDFQVPGRGELRCLQDAIDHSAFTVLLLTPNFDCRLSLHQINQAVMSSLTRHGWQDGVIPFLPLETSQAQLGPDAASLLGGLVWLDEHSPIFSRRVTNTFKPQKLRARKAYWEKEQEARALRAQTQHLEGARLQAAATHAAYAAYVQSYASWQAQMAQLQAAFGSHMALETQMPSGVQGPFAGQAPLGAPPAFPTWPGCPQPPPPYPGQPGIPPPAFPQPSPAFQTPPPASPAPPQSPGPQPLIIHHAQMVQLGVNNHMWSQREAQAPEDRSQEAE